MESIRAEEASVDRLFNADAGDVRVGRGARRSNPRYSELLLEAARLVSDVLNGRKKVHYLQEAMTTSDFPLLFGDILDRQLLANYRETPQTFRSYIKVAQVRDFRTVNRFAINGGEARLQAVGTVPEATEYPYDKLSEARYQYAVQKYGKKYRYTWEDMVNDDLEALRDTPERMGRSARRTEEFFATDLFVGTAGPDGTFFAGGNANVVTSNPALSITALQTAFQVLAAQTDSDGEPIDIGMAHLVVPPALEVTA